LSVSAARLTCFHGLGLFKTFDSGDIDARTREPLFCGRKHVRGKLMGMPKNDRLIAEKIRAASQRSKIRDLHDLAEIANRALNRDLIRSLAVLKLWNSGGPGLDYHRLCDRVKDGRDHDISDLANLLRKDQRPDLNGMIRRVIDCCRFLGNLSDREQILAADGGQKHREELELLIASFVKR
jgi:hypothetical protein